MISQSELRIGLIGCGLVAETRHLPALLSLPNARVAAVADTNAECLARVADRFRIPRRHPDYRALLDDAAIDAVAICAPAQFHVPIALDALDAGKHVFIEKPLALSLAEGQRLLERAAQSPQRVMLGFNLRWHRLVRRARELVQSGALGRIEAIRTVISSGTRYHSDVAEWRKRRALGGGVLLEVAVHHFDLWRYLLESEVEQIFAPSRSDEWEDVTASVSARMTNGVLVSSVFSMASHNNNEIEIYGQVGRLRVALYRFDGLEFLPAATMPGDLRYRARQFAQALRELPRVAPVIAKGGDYVASFRNEWEHFVRAIERDKPIECTVEDGQRALEIVMAAVSSAEMGAPVRVRRTILDDARIVEGAANVS
jgi:predicted dehydrogenase